MSYYVEGGNSICGAAQCCLIEQEALFSVEQHSKLLPGLAGGNSFRWTAVWVKTTFICGASQWVITWSGRRHFFLWSSSWVGTCTFLGTQFVTGTSLQNKNNIDIKYLQRIQKIKAKRLENQRKERWTGRRRTNRIRTWIDYRYATSKINS